MLYWRVCVSSVFLKDAKMFSKAVVSVYPPTSRHECYHCSMFSPTLGVAIILNFHECEGCETVSYYCYNLHSTNVNEVEHIFMYLLSFKFSFLWIASSFTWHIFHCIDYFSYWFVSFLNILWIGTIWAIYFESIYNQYMVCFLQKDNIFRAVLGSQQNWEGSTEISHILLPLHVYSLPHY